MKTLVTLLAAMFLSVNAFGQTLQHRVDSLVSVRPAKIGVMVKYGGDVLCRVNSDMAFPMMSVFKLHQAVAVVDSIGQKKLRRKVLITKEMLRPDTYSPLRDEYPEGDVSMSIEDLLHYTLWYSDNNACDVLFDMFGGIDYTARKAKKLGLMHTQIKWTEEEMHRDTSRCRDNFTTPEDAVALLEHAYANDCLRRCLAECRTGKSRIPALLPSETIVGHKTGTGDVAADGRQQGINDIGFVMLPDGTHYFIAIFCDDSKMTLSETEAVIAEIAYITYAMLAEQKSPIVNKKS